MVQKEKRGIDSRLILLSLSFLRFYVLIYRVLKLDGVEISREKLKVKIKSMIPMYTSKQGTHITWSHHSCHRLSSKSWVWGEGRKGEIIKRRR